MHKQRKIRVLQLVEDFKLGGQERVIENIFNGLRRDKYIVSLWCIAKGGDLADNFVKQKKDVKILNIKTYHNPLNVVKLAALIRKQKFDIVHTHGYFASTIGRISAFLARTPLIIAHIHTTYWGFKKRHLRIEKALSWVTDNIICCSIAVKKFVVSKEKINSKKITTIYNGVHCRTIKNTEVEKKNNDQETVSIVIVASLVENKGHKILLEAFAKIVPFYNNVSLSIIGNGPLKYQLLDKARRLKVNEQTEFLGLIHNVQMVIRNCDIVVLPSVFREGLGMAIIEGMCLAKPVIASNIGGIPELVDNGVNGFLVPPGNVDYLSEKLKILINNRELRNKMGQEGRLKFEKNFDANIMNERIEMLYHSLLEKKRFSKIYNFSLES
jgi:glycosyltransferase involved in cell wall biosynthesis